MKRFSIKCVCICDFGARMYVRVLLCVCAHSRVCFCVFHLYSPCNNRTLYRENRDGVYRFRHIPLDRNNIYVCLILHVFSKKAHIVCFFATFFCSLPCRSVAIALPLFFSSRSSLEYSILYAKDFWLFNKVRSEIRLRFIRVGNAEISYCQMWWREEQKIGGGGSNNSNSRSNVIIINMFVICEVLHNDYCRWRRRRAARAQFMWRKNETNSKILGNRITHIIYIQHWKAAHTI